MPEYFIKPGNDPKAESIGPFSVEILKTLADSGKISRDTAHFYDDLLGWQPISANEPLAKALFAEKPKLGLKKVAAPIEKTSSEKKTEKATNPSPITVEGMLQSAQGKTEATRDQTMEKRWIDRVAALSLPILALVNILMGALIVFSHYQELARIMKASAYQELILIPGLVLGGLIFLSGVLLLLSLVAAYPAVRYLALALLGYLGLQAWSYLYEGLWQGWLLLASGIGFGLGVYIMTLTLNFTVFTLSMICALGGIGSYGYFLFLTM